MSKCLVRFAAVFGLALSLSVAVFGAEKIQDATSHSAEAKLLEGPERQDIPWKVNVSSPRLMYQQVYLVRLRVRIDGVALKRATNTRTLHFILKVQSADGKWLSGGEYKDYQVPVELSSQTEIEYETCAYFRPGDYKLTLVVFDGESGKSSVIRNAIHVSQLNDDPFAELDRYLAPIEFPGGFPQQEIGNESLNDGELFPVALARAPIPIANPRPALVDIVLDIAKRPKPQVPEYFDRMMRSPRFRPRPEPPTIPAYDFEVGRLLQAGDLLARLGLQSGCVRVSAVDALRMKTVLDRTDENKMDWARFEGRVLKFDQDTVDVSVLSNRKGPAQFMRRYLDELSADTSGCASGGTHYIIVVTHEVPFPAKDERLAAADGERARFYYLYNRIGSNFGDDLADLLKPVKPERLSFDSPRDLRKALAKIVSDLRAGK
jgi:hypothetical protein